MRVHTLYVCLTALLVMALPVRAETFIVAADEWCPYNCEPGSNSEGYVVEILREIFEPAGIDVDYRAMGWRRAVAEARSGRISAVIGASLEESEGLILPEEEVAIDSFVYIVRVNNPWRYEGLESLIGKRIGVPSGYYLGHALETFLEAHKHEVGVYRAGRVEPSRKLLTMLVGKRIDVISEDERVIRHAALLMGLEDSIRVAGKVTESGDKLYVAFSPGAKAAEYIRVFDAGIRELRARGRLQEILTKYGLEDWKTIK